MIGLSSKSPRERPEQILRVPTGNLSNGYIREQERTGERIHRKLEPLSVEEKLKGLK